MLCFQGAQRMPRSLVDLLSRDFICDFCVFIVARRLRGVLDSVYNTKILYFLLCFCTSEYKCTLYLNLTILLPHSGALLSPLLSKPSAFYFHVFCPISLKIILDSMWEKTCCFPESILFVNMIISCSIFFSANDKNSFFFLMVEYNSIVYTYHSLSVHPSGDGHLS